MITDLGRGYFSSADFVLYPDARSFFYTFVTHSNLKFCIINNA